MKRIFIVTLISISFFSLKAQVQLKGDYNEEDSIAIFSAYANAKEAVEPMWEDIQVIMDSEDPEAAWNEHEYFVKWLGKPEKLPMVYRKIHRIHDRFDKKFYLVVVKKNRGRCRGWISAWTLPFGKVKIRLCDDFLKYRTYLHEKTIIHEIGHEAGMLLHRRIHGCHAAERAALSHSIVAKRSPENYAWLAVSYIGIECSNGGR